MATTASSSLSLKEQYDRDGYLLIPGFASPEEVAGLRSQADKLLNEVDTKSISIFSTQSHMQGGDQYFLKSGDKIHFFFEEHAFDKEGNLKQERSKSINKIGHALHDLDPVFGAFTRSQKMKDLAASLAVQDPKIVQSMYICKQPKIGGKVVPHQDATFLYTEPMTTIGFWVALEDCTTTNGCLWAMPGSHKLPLKRRWLLSPDGICTYFDPPKEKTEDWSDQLDKFVPLAVTAGTMVVIHGHLVHWREENRPDKSRHAYTWHMIGGNSKYPANNWLQRKEPWTSL